MAKYYKEFNAIFYQKKGLAEQFVPQLNSLVKELEAKLNAAFGTSISFKTKWYKANDGIETPRFYIEDTSNTIKFVENDVDALDDIELKVKSSSVKLLPKLVKVIILKYRRNPAYATIRTNKVVVFKYDTYYDMQDLPRVVNEYVDANGFANESANTLSLEKSACALESLIARELDIDVQISSISAANFNNVIIKTAKTKVKTASKNLLSAIATTVSINFGKSFYDEDEQEITFDAAEIVFYSNNKVTAVPLYKTAAYDIANAQWRIFS